MNDVTITGQKELPGMEGRHIEPIHSLALQVDALCKKRQEITTEEKELRQKLTSAMELHGFKERDYEVDGVKVEYDPRQPDPKPTVHVHITADPKATDDKDLPQAAAAEPTEENEGASETQAQPEGAGSEPTTVQ